MLPPNGAAVAAVTLSGQGIKDTQDLVLGGIMVDGTPAAAAFVQSVTREVMLPVIQSGNILVEGSLQGDDVGDCRMGVELMYDA